MGSGNWTASTYATYTTSSKGYATLDSFVNDMTLKAQSLYQARGLSKVLNPYKVMRECRDSDEHPETLPVILALDVTGSMGDAAVKVSQKLNKIMTSLYEDETVKDVEFCIMGIGDFYCDSVPVQISQFESDVRIAEQLDELFFEFGGGGNTYESYSAAWYMGLHHCDLDCWKRGKKGIIITIGDEGPNPYLPKEGRYAGITTTIGDILETDVDTKTLYAEAAQKFDIYHISIDNSSSCYQYHQQHYDIDSKWQELLGPDNYKVATLDSLAKDIVDIITNNEKTTISFVENSSFEGIYW